MVAYSKAKRKVLTRKQQFDRMTTAPAVDVLHSVTVSSWAVFRWSASGMAEVDGPPTVAVASPQAA
jgi:hypothetical protein